VRHDVRPESVTQVSVWDAALKNYGPNLGYDYGGRLTATWLDRQGSPRGDAAAGQTVRFLK